MGAVATVRILLSAMAVATVAGCSLNNGVTVAPGEQIPFLSEFGGDGSATIRDVPPTPFVPITSGTPEPLSAEQIAAGARMELLGNFQNSVMDEVTALTERLQRDRASGALIFFGRIADPTPVESKQ